MKHWNLSIDWFDDGKKVLSAVTSTEVMDGEKALDSVMLLTSGLSAMCDLGNDVLRKDNMTWDRRATSIMLVVGSKRRSITVEQTAAMQEREANKCANQVMDWLTGAETTELLEA
jgi:hypothetical protein